MASPAVGLPASSLLWTTRRDAWGFRFAKSEHSWVSDLHIYSVTGTCQSLIYLLTPQVFG